MAKTTTKKVAAKSAKSADKPKRSIKPKSGYFGWKPETWIESASSGVNAEAKIQIFGSKLPWAQVQKKIEKAFTKLQLKTMEEKKASLVLTEQGPSWIISLAEKADRRQDQLAKSEFGLARDRVGALVPQLRTLTKQLGIEKVLVEFIQTSKDEELGAWTGLELGTYSFKKIYSGKADPLPALVFAGNKSVKEARDAGAILARSVNLSRHLINLPPRDLNPESYSKLVESHFSGRTGVKVEIWDNQKLVEEDLHLLHAVGKGAEFGPRLVIMKWRPAKGGSKPPIAIVGKGITFDSGGLDIKPSAGMRLMKKDMGGSAAAVGIFNWVVESKLPMPVDVYLCLAENAIDAKSFHPSDVIETRAGLSIEIHNTDAEGRLVLADGMTIAAESEPAAIIDLATLTGAIKVALGADISGLFSNRDAMARQLENASLEAGEATWRMPLYPPYKNLLRSHFADHANASDGFAGAITAAMFLEFFAKDIPWAHFDIYAWRDSADGAYTETGGSGQGVLGVTRWLAQTAKRK